MSRTYLVLACAAFFVVLAIAVAGFSAHRSSAASTSVTNAAPTASATASTPESFADALASVNASNASQNITPDDPSIQAQLVALNSYYPVNTDNTAFLFDEGQHMQSIELSMGVHESLLSILQAVNQTCSSGDKPDADGVIARLTAYACFRGEGLSRDQAISQIPARAAKTEQFTHELGL
jgi:hypothetical protein